MDGPVITGSVVIGNWSGICEQLLGKVSEKFFGGRIEMKWLQHNFQDLDGSFSPLERVQHARAYILRLIKGFLMLDKSLALFEWTPYFDPRIRECISSEFLVNPNIWHVKVPLIVYAMVEMHESD
ncbi:hypothetical protein J1N35_033979 [Gossypium stocksii]|uniref:Uncharacterized protein n=1 Tax=Gossypium stocksii TaxID=47602 RepID=A0A9D3ZPM5_9ROSI|nr:hypothetical protein J1N35_033979 [Gossypium stocksii]